MKTKILNSLSLRAFNDISRVYRLFCFVTILSLCFPLTAITQQKITSIKKKENQLNRLARQYEAAGRFEESLQLYQRLWKDNPRNITYYRGIKKNLLNLKRFPEAIQVIEKMLKIKRSYYVEADLGDIYYKLGEKERAFQIWDDIIRRNKTKPAAYQAVANSMVSNRLLDEAIKIYLNGRENVLNKSIFIVELANLYSSRLDYKNATLMYLEYLKYMPNQFSFVEGHLSRLAKNIEDIDPIINILVEQVKLEKDSLLLRKLLAGLYTQSSNYQKALEEYKFIDANDSHKNKKIWGNELFNFARNAFNDGAYKYSEQAFNILISQYPESSYVPRAKFGIAEAFFRQQNYAKAIKFYKEIINTYPQNIEAKKSYFQIGEIKLNHLRDPNSAKEIFKELLNKFPVSPEHFEAMFKIGDCEIQLNALDQAKKWYQRAATKKQASDEIIEKAQYKLALIDFWEGNFNAALKKLEQIIQMPAILRNEKSGFYVNDALKLSIFIEENQQQPEILKKYAECLLLSEQLHYDKALTKLKVLVENNPQASFADNIWLKIGEIENDLQHFQEAINAYQTIINNYPMSTNCDIAQKRIGEIYEKGLGNIGGAMKAYELVLANYPESLLLEEVRKNIRELEKTSLR